MGNGIFLSNLRTTYLPCSRNAWGTQGLVLKFQLSNWSANSLNLWEATAKGNLYQNALVP